ncbi:Hypothetical predicted protein [Lecanosticta acicola]|uniref:Uncharacterized protein n=1 Tax=Lecanosticta acicola TaxID=111012 RepID=A0AAI8Z009_9PEZI|nr:Hypothetical predicted protein [Lecanosticta acicola]
MIASILCMVLGGVASTWALPLPDSGANSISEEDLVNIAPITAACDGTWGGECRPASEAAPAISQSFVDYAVKTFNTQAALVALMLYESANFKYAKNHYPGIPGQGTRNMMSPTNVEKYAEWLVTNQPDSGITAQEISEAKAQGPTAVLDLVNATNELSFGSAAWFLTTQCDSSVRAALDAGTGWEQYLTSCIGTTATAERAAVYAKVMALKQW